MDQDECSQCGARMGAADLARINDNLVCAACKPLLIQRLREGVPVGRITSAPAAGKPRSAMVFGILSICFGSWGLLMMPIGLVAAFFMMRNLPQDPLQQKMMIPMAYQIPMSVMLILLRLFMLIAGIRLLRASMSARKMFMVYCVLGIIIPPLLQIYPTLHMVFAMGEMPPGAPANMPPGMQGFMSAAIIFGAVMGMLWAAAFPAIGLIFMTRKRVRAAYQHYNSAPGPAEPSEG